ncbi:MAG: DUF1573 domain-containing protein [Catalinimonas sp.]
MRKHAPLLCFAALLLAGPLAAQGIMSFQTEAHDFGDVVEGTKAEHEFTFTNTGDQPVVISSVRASCGCTTPHWTREPILPGQSGSIKASYNSQGRPGGFHKTITVTSNAATPSRVLRISGSVVDQPAYTAEELARSPRVQADQVRLAMGKVELGQHATRTFRVQNTGKSDLVIEGHRSNCDCIELEPAQTTLAPGASTAVKVTYAPRYDRSESVMLLTNDLTTPALEITLRADVVQSLSTSPTLMREEKAAVPFK